MPPDATDTKRRILVAARSEFARHGLAGARIDRIAETARVNKRSIYVHHGPKEELFDLIVGHAITDMANEVPFTVDDLPGYAGRLFDYLVATPEVLRLVTWAGLERPEASMEEVDAYRPKVAALSETYDGAAVDILALVLGLITAWHNASPALRVLGADQPWSTRRLVDFRTHMVTAVAAVVQS